MKQTYGRDLSIYDKAFLMKSLERRWIETKVNNVNEYCDYIEKNNSEADVFYKSLHITFSQFFRDSVTFATLEQNVLPSIISCKPEGSEIRIWSAGCSNGQEAYSIAMLISDFAEAMGTKIRFRIFATDISNEALDMARAGVYNQNEVRNVKLKQLNKYFTKQGKNYTSIPKLREFINFSTYNLLDLSTANPPESIYGDFDIVICCNLLIYYKSDLQQVIIKKLQQAMSASGYLITGEAEKNLVENVTKLSWITTPTAVFKNNKRRQAL
jgi:chemotaxis protein methyltransferase CheR